MGLFFNKKKKEPKPTNFKVTPSELNHIIQLAYDAIDEGQIEYELEFEFNARIHVIGIAYDRVHAPRKGYFSEYVSFYLDDQNFQTLDDLYTHATIDGMHYCDLGREFVLDLIFKTVLEYDDIEINWL